MDHSAITFSLIHREDGLTLIGFSLTAVETYAECFCVTFPFAQAKGKARVEFGDGEIRFVHDGIGSDETPEQLSIYGSSEGGIHTAPIDSAAAAALKLLLARERGYEDATLKVKPVIAWGKGFELRAELPPGR